MKNATVIAFAQNSRNEVRILGTDGQVAGALAAEPGMKQTTYVLIMKKIPCGTILSDGNSQQEIK